MNNHPDEFPIISNNHVLDLDVTNPVVNQEHTGQKQKTGQGWYARLSAKKKAEYLQRRRLARQQKKAATLATLNSSIQLSQTPASSL